LEIDVALLQLKVKFKSIKMASKYLQKFPVSGAFPDLLHDFAREVLRDQPEDIYEYGAAYFKAMENVSVSQSCNLFLGR